MGTQVYPRDTIGRFASKVNRGMRWLAIRFAIAVVGTVLLLSGYAYSQFETANMIVAYGPMIEEQGIAPILKKIAIAESGDRQFDANGLPVLHANTNGSVDIGRYQINNRVWGAKAKELGFNLITDEGQTAMATWLLQNMGTEPWQSSGKGWK